MQIPRSIINAEKQNCCLDQAHFNVILIIDRREEVEISVIQRAFQVVYWMMKEEIANKV